MQTAAIDVRAAREQLGHSLGDAMDRMMALLLRGVRRELSRTGMSTLATLRDQGPQRITDLAALERVTQPSMTALVNRLEEQGYVLRTPDPEDGRAVRVSITDAGLGLQRRLHEARAAKLMERLDDFTEAEREQLATAVPLLSRLAGETPAQAP